MKAPPRFSGLALAGPPAAVLAALALGCSAPPAPEPPRNAIVILVDTLRADHLGLYGYGRETDPVLQRFARGSVVFRRSRSQAGCTFPSVNSILTSRHPVHFLRRIDEHGMAIPPDTPSLAEILRGRGFSTAAVSASMVVRATPSSVNRQGGFGRGFGEFHEGCLERGGRAPCVNREALRLLDELPEPFLLYLHYMDPHGPYRPPSWHDRRFALREPDRSWVALGEPRRLAEKIYEGRNDIRFDRSDLAHFVDLYDEEILFFDSQLSVLLARLEETGLLERTAVALVSDHGEELLDHGEYGHCRSIAYETLLATPMVVRSPGIEPGDRDVLARNLDLVPTLLDLLEVEHDPEAFEGASLWPLLFDREREREFGYDFAAQGTARVVTDGTEKLIWDLESGRLRLYDLGTDPAERVDLAEREPARAERLRRVLADWIDLREGPASAADSIRRAREHEARLRALGYL